MTAGRQNWIYPYKKLAEHGSIWHYRQYLLSFLFLIKLKQKQDTRKKNNFVIKRNHDEELNRFTKWLQNI